MRFFDVLPAQSPCAFTRRKEHRDGLSRVAVESQIQLLVKGSRPWLMYSGGPQALELLQKNITYVVIEPSESTEFRANKQFFEQRFESVQQTDRYAIYKI
jgi:hypothetical protein